jgi:hypothetical protein
MQRMRRYAADVQTEQEGSMTLTSSLSSAREPAVALPVLTDCCHASAQYEGGLSSYRRILLVLFSALPVYPFGLREAIIRQVW